MLRDKEYLRTLVRLAVPITVQYFILNALNAVDVMMIGQLGDTPVAGVGLANEIFFLLGLTVFGITSGSAIFTAQFWGKKDLPNLRRVIGVSLATSMLVVAFFVTVAIAFPQSALRLYTTDPAVIALGSQYLRIVGFCYLPWAVTATFAAVLRSTENIKLPMLVSIGALSLNTLLNYTLILGNFGFPALGVKGAAIATLIARSLECAVLLGFTYLKKTPAAATLHEMFNFKTGFLKKFFRTTLPVIINEGLWALGITTYSAVYARIGTEAIAAINVARAIESLVFVFFNGIGIACAIMVGNKIGAGDEQTAFQYGKRSLQLSIAVALLVGVLLMLTSGSIISLYQISEASQGFARRILLIAGLSLWVRGSNMTIFIGMLRSGGDTRYAFFTELFTIWGVGVPMALLSAFVFHLPVYWVYLAVLSDELIKFVVGALRVFSKRWINNLVHSIGTPLQPEPLPGE